MPSRPLSLLTLTTAFPNPNEPSHSPFVAARLTALSEHALIRVIAPVPWIDYSNPRRDLWASRRIPFTRHHGPLETWHPRWLFPPFGTPVNVLCLAARLLPLAARLHRMQPADWIDSHFGYPDGAAAALVAGVLRLPLCITIRGNEMVHSLQPARRAILRWALLRARRVIAVSEELRRFAVGLGVASSRCVTIPNGVDASVFYPRPLAEARAAAGLPPHARLLLSAGGLGPGKGHHLIIQTLTALLQRHPTLQFWLAGGVNRDGRYDAEIKALIERLGLQNHVRLLGPQPPERLSALMSAADVFALASFAEGWPNVVHEAQACGTPVVATQVGAIPQMLPSEHLGLTIPPGDIPALTAALDLALTRDWDREAIASFGRARTWQTVAQEVAALLRAAL